jgi:quercetin dioxygenase-like cupin family protein
MRRALLAIGAAVLVGSTAFAQSLVPPKRTPLQQTEFPDGHVIHMQYLELAPHTVIGRHTHPGVETSYILEGDLELTVEGKGTTKLKAGESFAVPANIPHAGKVGANPTKLIVTYVVQKGKPIATPAP